MALRGSAAAGTKGRNEAELTTDVVNVYPDYASSLGAAMPPSEESLGQLEREVLQFIAGQSAQTVREVADHFATASGQARTTILTVMERLRGKGYLKRKKVEDVHRYSATVSKEALLDRLVGRFVEDVLGGTVSPFLAYLSRSESLTEAETRKLNELIERIESREQGPQS